MLSTASASRTGLQNASKSSSSGERVGLPDFSTNGPEPLGARVSRVAVEHVSESGEVEEAGQARVVDHPS